MSKNITGHGAPTPKTVAIVGQRYIDLDTCDIYECMSVSTEKVEVDGPTRINKFVGMEYTSGHDIKYVWEKVGGAGAGQFMSAKLSDFENDLWYTKRIPIITLTSDKLTSYTAEFGFYEIPFDINTIKTFGFDIVFTREGEIISGTEEDNPSRKWEINKIVEGGISAITFWNEYWWVSLEYGAYYNEEDSLIANPGKLRICMPFYSADLTFTLYSVDEKKIPIEYCDTSEIEAEINNLTDEVLGL